MRGVKCSYGTACAWDCSSHLRIGIGQLGLKLPMDFHFHVLTGTWVKRSPCPLPWTSWRSVLWLLWFALLCVPVRVRSSGSTALRVKGSVLFLEHFLPDLHWSGRKTALAFLVPMLKGTWWGHARVGLDRTVYVLRTWPHNPWNICQEYRIHTTPYVYGSGQPCARVATAGWASPVGLPCFSYRTTLHMMRRPALEHRSKIPRYLTCHTIVALPLLYHCSTGALPLLHQYHSTSAPPLLHRCSTIAPPLSR